MVFAGTSAFAGPTLNQLVEAGHHVALVVTQPDRLGGRGMKPLQSEVKLQATELGLPIFQPERIRNEDAQARIRDLDADVMVVVAYGQILPASLINAPRLGTLNLHASLLPRHRGPAPIEWAILSGDQETGMTVMQMDAGVDTGAILSQEKISIGPDETAGHLEGQLANIGGRLLLRTLDELAAGRIHPTPQPSEGATHAPRLRSEDGKLDPATMSADEIDRRVRALGERIGTWITVNGVELKVFHGHPDGEPGAGVPVPTVSGLYVVDEVQPAGGRRMPAAAWARGRR
ncbi:MAG TPA: methionyl-tRNA formyltransferase [Candidatus Dormibacteraeota bacterium]|nr:methionyl-tRNA formyltransferase [Candidatus Dormibacteraeota bacterium]